MGTSSRGGRLLRTPVHTGWAAAASVLLVLGLVIGTGLQLRRGATEPGGLDGYPRGEARVTRTVDRELTRPQILSPLPGEALKAGGDRVCWTAVADSLYYHVHVVTDGGDVVWQERVADPFVSLPRSLPLEPGADYYLRVDAYLAEAMSVSSPHVPFTIGR